MKNAFTLCAVAIVSVSLLSGCAAQDSTPQPPPAPAPTIERDAAKAYIKETQACFYNSMAFDPVDVFFGSPAFPFDYYTDSNMSSPAGKGGPVAILSSRGWVCTDTRNDIAWDTYGSVDVFTTVTFPNGRKTNFAFANPATGAPIFYPANESQNRGPAAGQEYKVPVGSTYTCSMLGYDFSVTRQPDDADYKYWQVKIIGKAAATDDFDDQICQP